MIFRKIKKSKKRFFRKIKITVFEDITVSKMPNNFKIFVFF